MMEQTSKRHIIRWNQLESNPLDDELVVEEPLEIRIREQSLIVVMRTPGNDFELAAGFLYTENLIKSVDDIQIISYCDDENEDKESVGRNQPLTSFQNIVNVHLTNEMSLDEQQGWQRNFHANASCGLCGKMTIDAVRLQIDPINSDFQLMRTVFYKLNERLRMSQTIFEKTGGLHAAGLFDKNGELLILREDIGRHNAVDKVIGQALLSNMLPLDQHLLMVSGRASFEIIQKALFARIPVVVAVSAASSLAVDLAEEGNITLIGFLREKRMAVYSHPDRII
ncbi:formate dehydrogenase accessory sulfurtransferase FdhD [Candidatus Poribacteria bacterium]|nr:formate dehydrogenase accessory sulfurtransferase FdhD [Candidatus Poribacteria bacterium]